MKETKVVCPKCGASIAIPEHESFTVGVAIGKDSGLGTVTLPLESENNSNSKNKSEMKAAKKIQAMKAAGINVSNLFAVANAEGIEVIARLENGKLNILDDNDPVFVAIIKGGTVPNRRLFRRWVMAQVFHMMTQKKWNSDKPMGFLNALQAKGFRYSWEMLIEEIRVQAKLEVLDQENFIQRNRWFNKDVAVNMATDYLKQLNEHVEQRKKRCKRCKGNPYITLNGNDIFVDDLRKKVFNPLDKYVRMMKSAKDMTDLYHAIVGLYQIVKDIYSCYSIVMSPAFKDAYKGAGGYFTMRNLIMFHGCKMRSSKGNPLVELSSLRELDRLAEVYKNGEGWRMFGAMKELIARNGIDIEKKMNEWRCK